jgi:hypothetical protein
MNLKINLEKDLRRYFIITMPWFTCPEDNVIVRGRSLLLPQEAYDTLQRKEKAENKTSYTQCDSFMHWIYIHYTEFESKAAPIL